MAVSTIQDTGGLSHLVEAATALTKLIDASDVPSTLEKTEIEQNLRSIVSDDDDEDGSKKSTQRCKREIFPQRLMTILKDPSLSDVITWLPKGRSFEIIRPDVFMEEVLPKYLPPADARASTKYQSFTRKLNRWGFRQVTRGPDSGAFHHPLFRRDQPELCMNMVCQRSRERKDNKSCKSLPPKKRVINPLTPSTLTSSSDSANELSFRNGLTSQTSSLSAIADYKSCLGASLTSFPPNVGAFQSSQQISLGFVPSALNPSSTIINNSAANQVSLLKSALRQNQETARMEAAKAMLYNSYLKALKG